MAAKKSDMSYKFITGHNPQHDPGKRKEYIVCLEPHTAILQVHNDDKGKLASLEIKFLHVSISQFQPDTVQVTQMPTEQEISEIKARMLCNAWHWYKSVLDKA